jgi:hypothetical protein
MDKDIKNRVDRLVKSMYKAFEKASKKDVVADVMDSNRLSQVSPDAVAAPKGGTLNKAKKLDKRCWEGYEPTPGKKAYSEGSCQKKSEEIQKKQGVPEGADPETHERCVTKVKEKGHDKSSSFAICNEAKAGMGKSEDFIKDIMQKFEKISSAYLKKQEELEKARMDEGFGATQKKKMRAERSPGFQPHKKEKFTQSGYRQMPKPTDQMALKQKLQSKAKTPKADDLEYPMAASEKKEKPFHGYNAEKHSKEGGLSAKAREKYNRETGSNLQAPVSSKEAEKSPKKAARRKSFCARMSGVKGETSKDGKPTPKGAALKRWDC